jgi:hypothetical protein
MKTQKTMNSQCNSEQKVQCWWYHNSWLQTIVQSHNNKKSMVLAQLQTEKQWMKTEDPDINPHIYSQLIFNKGAQNTWWKKDSLFNKHCWENWISTCRRVKLDSCLSPTPKSTQSDQRP